MIRVLYAFFYKGTGIVIAQAAGVRLILVTSKFVFPYLKKRIAFSKTRKIGKRSTNWTEFSMILTSSWFEVIVAGCRLRWKVLFHQLCLPAISPLHAPSKLKESQTGHSTTNFKR